MYRESAKNAASFQRVWRNDRCMKQACEKIKREIWNRDKNAKKNVKGRRPDSHRDRDRQQIDIDRGQRHRALYLSTMWQPF